MMRTINPPINQAQIAPGPARVAAQDAAKSQPEPMIPPKDRKRRSHVERALLSFLSEDSASFSIFSI